MLQSYTASVLKGSNPTFKWTVDDKPYFTYFNSVLNVIYQNAAIYKLTVSFSHMFKLGLCYSVDAQTYFFPLYLWPRWGLFNLVGLKKLSSRYFLYLFIDCVFGAGCCIVCVSVCTQHWFMFLFYLLFLFQSAKSEVDFKNLNQLILNSVHGPTQSCMEKYGI